jgi:hypothetical protein
VRLQRVGRAARGRCSRRAARAQGDENREQETATQGFTEGS